MATVGDPTDPRGTKRPNKDPILVSTHTFRLVIVIERSCKVCFPPEICSDDIYDIFSLFFSDKVLTIIIKHKHI